MQESSRWSSPSPTRSLLDVVARVFAYFRRSMHQDNPFTQSLFGDDCGGIGDTTGEAQHGQASGQILISSCCPTSRTRASDGPDGDQDEGRRASSHSHPHKSSSEERDVQEHLHKAPAHASQWWTRLLELIKRSHASTQAEAPTQVVPRDAFLGPVGCRSWSWSGRSSSKRQGRNSLSKTGNSCKGPTSQAKARSRFVLDATRRFA